MTTFTISKNKLITALSRCKQVVDRKSVQPEYNSFLFFFKDERLQVAATDGDVYIQESLALDHFDGDASIAFSIHPQYLLRAIKSLDDQPIRFEVGEYQTKIIHYYGSFYVPSVREESFLAVIITKNDLFNYHTCEDGCEYKPVINHFTFEAPGLKKWIKLCCDSVADDTLRPAMNCVCMHYDKSSIEFAASDGHQLTVIKKEMDNSDKAGGDFLIPRKVCNVIQKCFPNTGMVDFLFILYYHITDRYDQKPVGSFFVELDTEDRLHTLFVRFNDYSMECRYPKYHSVIPDYYNYCVECDRKELLRSVSRMNDFAFRSTLKFSITPDTLTMSCRNEDYEIGADETIPCTLEIKTPLKPICDTGFNGNSLVSILKRISTDSVRLCFVDATNAVLIYPEPQPSVEQETFLLMPLFLSNQ